ncbi:hypothetical protein [Cyclobacterium amurskyense]
MDFYLLKGPLLYTNFNPKYAIDNLLSAEIALKSATSLLFSISP